MADRRVVQTGHSSRQLGRYELIAEIASGGMGTVLLGRLAGAGGFQRLFAIKLLHKAYAQDHEFIQMLLDEARIAALIHHPNVVSIQEVEESPEHGYFLVMDYVEGFPLWDLGHAMKSAPPQIRWRIVMRSAVDALNGLEAAHTAVDEDGRPLNVVHRDISPQNILVSVNGIGRVTDFGIAKAAARITTTRVGQVKGKLAYMSPEQAKGRPLDHRTDLWAMGVVIWEQLTGARLFKVENESETYKRVLDAPIPRLRELIPQTPPEVDAVIARALERDVNKRWPSAREMVTALERAARATELLADAHETGEYIRNSFQAELTLRRAAIRQAASQKSVEPGKGTASLPGGLVVPQLPEHSVSLTVSPPPGPPPVALPQPGSDEYEESMDTIVVASEPARDIDDMSTFKVNPAQNSPAVQKALQHARAVMASPGAPAPQAGPTRRASGSMSAVAASNPPPRTAGDPAAHDAGASNPAPSIFAGPHMPTVQLDSVPRGPQAPVASVTPAPTSVAAPSASRRTPVGLWITVGIVAALGATVVAGLQLGWFPFAARAGRAADSASGSPPAPTPQRPTTPSGAHLPIPPPSNVVAHGPVVSGDAAAPAPSAPDAASTAAPTLAGPDASHAASITDAAGTLAPTAPPAIPAPTNAPAPSSPNPPANVHHHHGRDGGSGHGAMIEVPPA